MESEPMLTPMENSLNWKNSAQRRIEPMAVHHAAQHTTNEQFRPWIILTISSIITVRCLLLIVIITITIMLYSVFDCEHIGPIMLYSVFDCEQIGPIMLCNVFDCAERCACVLWADESHHAM